MAPTRKKINPAAWRGKVTTTKYNLRRLLCALTCRGSGQQPVRLGHFAVYRPEPVLLYPQLADRQFHRPDPFLRQATAGNPAILRGYKYCQDTGGPGYPGNGPDDVRLGGGLPG